jgi:putative ABC transport system substrate-binding protein
MRRRDVIALFSAAAAMPSCLWPLAARAQQPQRTRHIGALMNYAEGDPEARARVAAFEQGLEKLGWTAGRNILIDYCYGQGEAERTRAAAVELVRLAPEVILANGTTALDPLQQATRTIPIVFALVSEPVAMGYVASLARPRGNTTGFSQLEPTFGAKWLEMLKEMAPHISRVAVMFNPENPATQMFFRSVEAAAAKFAVTAIEALVRAPADIEATMTMLGGEPGGGLILPANAFTGAHRKLIIERAARYRVPAIYSTRASTADGGLISYGVDTADQFRQAAGYVDRILRGEKPANLPVQQPVKFELVINMKTAKALGLTVPLTLQVAADEVIE